MPASTSIFIADVAIAFRALEPGGSETEQTRRAIVELLGLRIASEEISAPPAVIPASEPAGPSPANTQPERGAEEAESAEDDASPAPDAAAATQWKPSILETQKLPPPPRDAAVLLQNVRALPPPQPAASELAQASAPDPLFEPTWSRAILTGLMATSRDGELDLEALIERVAKREHIEKLPRLALPTLRRGTQLLIDVSAGMTPFFSDQLWVLKEMERLLGRELLQVLSFIALPTRGMGAQFKEGDEQPYASPLPGTPVILLSDLGIARPRGTSDRASVDEWAEFATQVRKAGCPLVVLLPYPPARWPRELRGLITMVHWDPLTTAGRMRNIIGRAHQVS